MEIILTKDDIKSLIKKTYSGIKDVKFNVKILKVTLEVDIEKFVASQRQQPRSAFVPQQEQLSPEETLQKEAKSGVMASGGKKRVLKAVG